MPGGIVEEDPGQRRLPCGRSSTTSAGIVAALPARWAALDRPEKAATAWLQSNRDHGPERRGRRTPCLHRLVQLADEIGTPIPLLSSPPSHST